MAQVAPEGPVYQAGTLSGNPVAMAAGIATLKKLQVKGVYDVLEKKSKMLEKGLANAIDKTGTQARVGRVGAMLGMFFTDRPVRNFEDAKSSDLKMFSAYYQAMLEKNIYLAPSQFEAFFMSTAHTDAQIEHTIASAEAVLKLL